MIRRFRVLPLAGPAPQPLTASLFTNTNTIYSATLAATYALTPSLFANSNTFNSHTLSSTYNLSPALFREKAVARIT